jgi:arylsulfatase A-like enzyme
LGQGADQVEHDYLYWEYNRNQAIRSGKWFAHRKNGGNVELYNLQQDPQQGEDLAKQQPDLARQILQWMQESHRPSEVWPSPGESTEAFQQRMKAAGIPSRPKNVDG